MPDISTLPTEQAKAFNLQTRSCYYLDDSDFGAGTLAVYGRRIDIIDSPNDTTHEYSDVGKEAPLLFDQDTLDDAISQGHIEAHLADIVLWDLVQKGILPAGDYFIRVSW